MKKRATSLTVNVDSPTLERLDRHVRRHRPLLTRHSTHWVALNLGLTVLEREPALLLRFLEQDAR